MVFPRECRTGYGVSRTVRSYCTVWSVHMMVGHCWNGYPHEWKPFTPRTGNLAVVSSLVEIGDSMDDISSRSKG